MEKEASIKQIHCLAFLSPDEGSKWCAVALEMDIWGFGDTMEEAMADLDELINTQIEFALEKKKPSILDHPTDKKWFDLWDALDKIRKENKQASNSLSFSLQATESTKSLPSPEKAICYHRAA